MTWKVIATVVGLALLPISGTSLAAPILLEHRFNQPGSTVASTGSDTTTSTFYTAAGVAMNLHGAAGSGVSGQPTDLAFDNSSATGMGEGSTGGYLRQDVNSPATDGLRSFTIMGWFKTASTTTVRNSANLLSNMGPEGYVLFAPSSGNLALEVAGSGSGGGAVYSAGTGAVGSSSTTGSYTATQAWVFFAVSYDSATDDVRFYKGDATNGVALVAQRVLDAGVTGANTTLLTIGNSHAANTRPFDGLFDNLRITGSSTDSAGVVSLAELEQFRLADLANVPEPSHAALGFAVAGLLVRRRRGSAAR